MTHLVDWRPLGEFRGPKIDCPDQNFERASQPIDRRIERVQPFLNCSSVKENRVSKSKKLAVITTACEAVDYHCHFSLPRKLGIEPKVFVSFIRWGHSMY